ncbi:translocation/assembly module TamB [bacterium]|nr:translocation/assembly module TamB [bacterium]
MKQFLKAILYFILSLIVAGIAFIATVWFFPKTIVNNTVLHWGYQQQDLIKFERGFPENLELDVYNVGFLKKGVKLKVKDTCIYTSNKQIQTCLDTVDIKVLLDFSDFSIKLYSLGPVIFHAHDFKFLNQPNSKQKNKKPFVVEDFLSEDFFMNRLDVNFGNIEIIDDLKKYTADLKITGKTVDDDYILDVLSSFSYEKSKKLALKLQGKVNTLKNVIASVKLTNQVNDQVNSQLKGDLKLDLLNTKASFLGEGYADQLSDAIKRVNIKKIKFDNFDKLYLSVDFASQLVLESLYSVESSSLPKPKIKTSFTGKAEAKESQPGIIDYKIELDPIEQYGTTIIANTQGSYTKNKQKITIKELLFLMEVPHFEHLVTKLEATQWAIPAPLNSLKGKVSIKLGQDSELESLEQRYFSIPINVETGLKSKDQSLGTQSSGQLVFDSTEKKIDMKLDVLLNNIKLAIPNFDPASSMPKVSSDERILSQNQKDQLSLESDLSQDKQLKQKETSLLSYEVTINTPNKPIRIMYDLFKPAAKFRLKGKINEHASTFTVKAEQFKVEYLKREAKLEKFVVKTDSNKESIYLDGRFSIKKADYDLYVNVEQRYETPQITLSSNPPLPEEDIISLILFNQLSNDVSSGSSNSVENTRAAIAQKTIGFFSFFVLASTPVESVNYDPNTKTYSARVKLPGGFTATVGSDWDEAQEVGIRKSLGGNWAISAGVGTDAQGEQKQESMLEWFYRY